MMQSAVEGDLASPVDVGFRVGALDDLCKLPSVLD
jgi:hypothetical protein